SLTYDPFLSCRHQTANRSDGDLPPPLHRVTSCARCRVDTGRTIICLSLLAGSRRLSRCLGLRGRGRLSRLGLSLLRSRCRFRLGFRCRLGRCLSLRCRCLCLCGLGLGLLRSRCRFRLGFLRWLSFSLLRRWLGRCLFLCGLGLDLLRGRVLAAVPVARCLVARTRGRLTGASGVLALLRRLRRLGINLGRGLDLGLLLTLVILGLRRLSLDLLRCLDLRSEEHTSELQSRFDLVCRLLPEK